jgi:prepilin-type N-terminal cleavage/methylation domain-containing protein
MQVQSNDQRASVRRGFTLIELTIVIAIIGILVAFVLAAGAEGVRNAQVRATQSLIAKLEVAMTDRIEALLNTTVSPNAAHFFFGAVPNPSAATAGQPPFLFSVSRADIIARVELFKTELPDVWFVDNNNANYPVNYPAFPYAPGGSTGTTLRGAAYDPFVVPLGSATYNNPSAGSYGAIPVSFASTNVPNETGIYGASHVARGALAKNLGFLDKGIDATDDGGVAGLIDDLQESNDGAGSLTQIQANLNSHKHHTARAEALYAALVEGRGPLGSVFTRDDFTTTEVQDTDGDGLPEFVDAWGNPLYFSFWPVYYHSDTQKGTASYGAFETREKTPLDPHLDLMAPAWWADITNSGNPTQPPQNVRSHLFSKMFFTLFEVNFPLSASSTGQLWDRQNVYGRRREYYTKFLILSAGPDGNFGVATVSDQTVRSNSAAQNSQAMTGEFDSTFPYTTKPPVFGESWAVPLILLPGGVLNNSGEDDISNQTLRSSGGGSL